MVGYSRLVVLVRYSTMLRWRFLFPAAVMLCVDASYLHRIATVHDFNSICDKFIHFAKINYDNKIILQLNNNQLRASIVFGAESKLASVLSINNVLFVVLRGNDIKLNGYVIEFMTAHQHLASKLIVFNAWPIASDNYYLCSKYGLTHELNDAMIKNHKLYHSDFAKKPTTIAIGDININSDNTIVDE